LNKDVQAAPELREASLRALHALIPEASLRHDFGPSYVNFLRELRERAHPRGHPDIREIAFPPELRLVVDVGDRLGCDFFYGFYQELFEALTFTSLFEGRQSVVIDVGANFGYYSVLTARRSGSGSSVHALEPDPDAYELLVRNADLNHVGGIMHCHAVCAGAADSEITFYQSQESAFSSARPTARSPIRAVIKVPERKLDSLAAEWGVNGIDGLKVDVEGFEPEVLAGAQALIAQSRDPAIMLEVSSKNLPPEPRQRLAEILHVLYEKHGFSGWLADAVPSGLRAIQTADEAASLHSANLFLVRADGEREAALKRAAQLLSATGGNLSLGCPDDGVVPEGSGGWGERGIQPSLALSAINERNAAIADLNEAQTVLASRLNAIEADSQTRLEVIREREAAIIKITEEREQLQLRLLEVEADSRQRLDVMRAREAQIEQLTERIEQLHSLIEKQREALSERDAFILALREHWLVGRLIRRLGAMLKSSR
jgi:FkbM family methyltransferase